MSQDQKHQSLPKLLPNAIVVVNDDSEGTMIEYRKKFKGKLYRYKRPALGRGSYSSVSFCMWERPNGTKSAVALKWIHKDAYKRINRTVIDEIKILEELHHPNLLKIFATHKSGDYFGIVTEVAPGGQLDAKLELQDGTIQRYSEASAATIIYQILDGVEYLHNNGIIHRDLKPDNILFRHWFPRLDAGRIVIIDFGLAIKVGEKPLKGRVGAWSYIAPEVLDDKEYTKPADIWSIGAISYELLSGMSTPSYKCVAEFEGETSNISDDAKDFIRKCLSTNPKERPTATEAKHYKWIRSNAGKTVEDVRKGFDPLSHWKLAIPIRKLKDNKKKTGDKFAGVEIVDMVLDDLGSGENGHHQTAEKKPAPPDTAAPPGEGRGQTSGTKHRAGGSESSLGAKGHADVRAGRLDSSTTSRHHRSPAPG